MLTDNQKPVIVLGAGGHAKVILDMLVRSGRKIQGIIAPDKVAGESLFGFKIIGDDKVISGFLPNSVELANGVGALPYTKHRWELAEKMRKQGYSFTTVIHPSAIVANDVKLADGVQVMAGVIIQPGTSVGRDSIINTGVLLDHDCNVAQNCHLASGVICSGEVNIEECVHIGAGTSIIQNINVGKNSVIAAGSVIYKDIEKGRIVIQEKLYKKLESNNDR